MYKRAWASFHARIRGSIIFTVFIEKVIFMLYISKELLSRKHLGKYESQMIRIHWTGHLALINKHANKSETKQNTFTGIWKLHYFLNVPNWVIPQKKSVTEGSGQGNKKHGFDVQHRNTAQRQEEKGRAWRAVRMEAHRMLKKRDKQVESLWFGFGLPASSELLPHALFSSLKAFAGNLLWAPPNPNTTNMLKNCMNADQ